MERINTISLKNVVPDVFVGEKIDSEVWTKDTKFVRLGSDTPYAYCVNASSGTGKTSLCSFLYGVRRDYQGEIMFDGRNVRDFSVDDWCVVRRRHLAYLPQELDIFGELSAFDNVLLKNRLTDFKSADEIRNMFEQLEIDNRIDTLAARMSVGQRQRLALIRALCQPFDFILLDEPVSHLDARNNSICAAMVATEAARQQATVIYTSVGNPLDFPSEIINLRL